MFTKITMIFLISVNVRCTIFLWSTCPI